MHRKMDCNSRKFKGLTQKQQHRIYIRILIYSRKIRRTKDGFVKKDISKDQSDVSGFRLPEFVDIIGKNYNY